MSKPFMRIPAAERAHRTAGAASGDLGSVETLGSSLLANQVDHQISGLITQGAFGIRVMRLIHQVAYQAPGRLRRPSPRLSQPVQQTTAHAVGVAPSLVTAVYARHLAATQRPDGHWVTMNARPPQSSSSVTVTAVALRAIQLYGHPSLATETKARIERIAGVKPRDTEEKAYQLVGLQWAALNADCGPHSAV